MAYIILTIVGVAALLLVKKDWQQKKQIIFVCSIIFVGALVYVLIDIFVLQSRNNITKGDFFAKIPWFEIGLYFVMLLVGYGAR
jgi:surface polysaccharide O-acyltransferase-like enzyme